MCYDIITRPLGQACAKYVNCMSSAKNVNCMSNFSCLSFCSEAITLLFTLLLLKAIRPIYILLPKADTLVGDEGKHSVHWRLRDNALYKFTFTIPYYTI